MDIIIFSGQSNMQGETESRPIENPVANAYEYLLLSDYLEPLNHPVGERLGYDEGHSSKVLLGESSKKRGSLVPAFCREYLKTRDQVVAIHTALGSTVIKQWQPDTERYKMMLTKIKKGIEKAKTVAEIDKIYFVWLQGESDAITKTTQEAYYDDLLALKNALKKDIGLDKFAIIKVGYFYSVAGWLADTPVEIRKKHDEIIMAAQEKAAKDDPDFVILTRITAELSVDKEQYISCECDGHYNNRAMNMIGEAAGKRLAEIANA